MEREMPYGMFAKKHQFQELKIVLWVRRLHSSQSAGKPRTHHPHPYRGDKAKGASLSWRGEREVLRMQNATTLLNVIQERGQRGMPLYELYRHLYNPELYLRAYAKLYPNQGSLTPGIDEDDTIDGFRLEQIQKITTVLRQERYIWKPVRRTYIPKSNGKRRALGIPNWSDKLMQEVMRSLLEAYYEPQFSNLSHGFRPIRSCATALTKVQKTWKGTKWWIEGDIEGYFDNINHERLLAILGETIEDNRFLTLVKRFLQAGYMEDWKYVPNLTGTPQGGVLSPLLSNIYLNELDKYVEQILIPNHTRGKRRKEHPEYTRIAERRQRLRKKGNLNEEKELTAKMRNLPSQDPFDPEYARTRYIRYADDFLIGFAGAKKEAVQIKGELTEFLRDNLKLELNQQKTLVSHASSQPARFLGYDIQVQNANDQITKGRRSINGQVGLRVPYATINAYCQEYMQNGKIMHDNMMSLESDYSIVSKYQMRLRGIRQYYLLAWNVSDLSQLVNTMEYSLLKTLARKYRTTVRKIKLRYVTKVDNGLGEQVKCVEAWGESEDGKRKLRAQFGGLPLRRDAKAAPRDLTLRRYTETRSELLQRILADKCEMCEAGRNIEVHHIRNLKNLTVKGKQPKPPWVIRMAELKRKTLAVCKPCHLKIHGGSFRPRQSNN